MSERASPVHRRLQPMRYLAVKRAARAIGAPLGVYAALSTGYVLTLTAAALLPRRSMRSSLPLPLFDLVIPAHNEERTLPRLLESISALDYPPERLRVHIVADNCTDR